MLRKAMLIGSNCCSPFRPARYVFSAVVGTARCAVPARVVAGGMNDRAALAFEGVAPLHAARTSQRDVPTTPNRSRRVAGRDRPVARATQNQIFRHALSLFPLTQQQPDDQPD